MKVRSLKRGYICALNVFNNRNAGVKPVQCLRVQSVRFWVICKILDKIFVCFTRGCSIIIFEVRNISANFSSLTKHAEVIDYVIRNGH